jgi:hypothetical protein
MKNVPFIDTDTGKNKTSFNEKELRNHKVLNQSQLTALPPEHQTDLLEIASACLPKLDICRETIHIIYLSRTWHNKTIRKILVSFLVASKTFLSLWHST